uniref:Uncharacterized protein n=1 Tax=Globisporangium ultimum (strain ATCC 200006 / CBS 805.95 / DAOM BR144) TaxID=431595 RepID=K3W4Z4_GLOUD
MLQKLLRIPGARVGSLPPAQQEFVQFAKRYDRMLQLSEQEICKLPLQHQHIVRNLQQQAAQE